ncbi:aryl hydrocarbon receptor isoform X2 [Engystomops pustulosus]|uniref:aryl hydrocarbon receptor isoform X2 n=1 Tax=Engystomops pustulosus TaxID=76066 RepID=UPI003AFB79F3
MTPPRHVTGHMLVTSPKVLSAAKTPASTETSAGKRNSLCSSSSSDSSSSGKEQQAAAPLSPHWLHGLLAACNALIWTYTRHRRGPGTVTGATPAAGCQEGHYIFTSQCLQRRTADMNSNVMYASRKRRKPVQKTVKPTQPDGVKSNPSKRHRDRLNTELDRLASLLPFPQEIISKLDKLSVLRLSVSYLRAKGFFEVALQSRKDGNGIGDNRRTVKMGDLHLLEGELLLQALNGFVLVVASDGLVFYASSTIQDYLGFQQSDVIHQSVFELIHTEDRPEFQRQLHWALDPAQPSETQRSSDGNEFSMVTCYKPEQLPPENSSFMERNFVCRLRCLLDNSSGFLAMSFQGRLKYLHGQNKKGKDGSGIPPQLALFALATPLQSPSILEIRTKNFIFRTKHRLDFTPIGCDTKGSLVLGYTEAELCIRGTGYQFIHAADMMYCADNHVRMIKTGESGMTIFRLLTKENGWAWVQANARLVYKNGRPDYIIATQRPLTEEEGAEHLRKRSTQLPFIFTSGEAVLYEASFPFPPLMGPTQNKPKGSSSKGTPAKATVSEAPVNPASMLGAMLRQDESVYICPPASNTFSFDNFYKDSDLSGKFWPNNRVPVANNNMKQEERSFPQVKSTTQVSERMDVLPEVKNNELYNIMTNLGIDFDDLEMIQQDEEFFRNEFDYPEIGDIDVADDILTYVQESLNRKPDCMFGNLLPQMSCVQDSGKVTQDGMDTPQMLPPQPNQMMPQQLCQKMKHMQVNGLLTNWNPMGSAPLTYQEQQPTEQYVPSLNNMAQEFYKSELSSAPYTCKQEYMPYQDSLPAVPLPSNLTQMDFDLGNVEQSMYTTTSTNLDGFLDCLPQTPELQECSLNAQSVMMTSQPCYSGAVSMYQCLPEPQPSCLNPMNPMQYNAGIPGQHQMINKFQNGFGGGNVNKAFTAPMDMANSAAAATLLPSHHHLPANSKLYPDLPSSGFL